MDGCVLIIAGSDSSGGAGIQADIKTVTALNGYASTAITALTAQNTMKVSGIVGIPPDFIKKQIKTVLEDIIPDAIKIGMLLSTKIVQIVVETLQEIVEQDEEQIPVVVDPVIFSKTKQALLEDDAIEMIQKDIFPLATLVTPNIPEAEIFAKMQILTLDDMRKASYKILRSGPEAVLIKGGHLIQNLQYMEVVPDILMTKEGETLLEGSYIATRHTHGTGCTFASAIATGIAQNMTIHDAFVRAHDYVHKAIKDAPGYGMGNGPLNHAHTFKN